MLSFPKSFSYYLLNSSIDCSNLETSSCLNIPSIQSYNPSHRVESKFSNDFFIPDYTVLMVLRIDIIESFRLFISFSSIPRDYITPFFPKRESYYFSNSSSYCSNLDTLSCLKIPSTYSYKPSHRVVSNVSNQLFIPSQTY